MGQDRMKPRFITLGRVEIEGMARPQADQLLRRPKLVALLVYLAAAAPGQYERRDKLLPLLWPERDQKRGRHALRNTLLGLRRVLGRDSIVNRGQEEIALSPDALLLDAAQFETAVDEARPADAVAIYGGDFLDGFHVRGVSAEFEHWIDRERDRLARKYRSALEQVARTHAADGKPDESIRAWRDLSTLDPLNADWLMHLMNELAASGDLASALCAAEVNEERLRLEYHREQDPAVWEFAEQLRAEPSKGPMRTTPGGSATDDSDHARATPDRGRRGRLRTHTIQLSVLAGVLLVAVLLAPIWRSPSDETGTARSVSSDSVMVQRDLGDRPGIAVLPFTHVDEPSQDRAFAQGFHSELLTQLGKVRSLQVKSLTSVLEYPDPSGDLRSIGRELGAAYVVEGRVQRAGNRIRINVALFDAEADERLWSHAYDEDLNVRNILDSQRDIAIQIATRLGAEILPSERAKLDVDPPSSLNAYEFYLSGLSQLRVLTMGGVSPAEARRAGRTAVRLFEESIAADPGWAPSRAALGIVHHWIASGGQEPAAHFTKSLEALQGALALDSLHAPVWSALGYVYSNFRPDLAAAEAAYLRASQLGAPDHHGYGVLLTAWGRFEEAHSALERAADADPLAAAVQLNRGWAYLCAGDYPRAASILRPANRPEAFGHMGVQFARALLLSGQTEAGMAEVARLELGSISRGQLAMLYALAGDLDRARALLDEADHTDERVRLDHAAAAVSLGDLGRARRYLEGLERSNIFPGDLLCYDLTGLEDDPSYRRIYDLIGIPKG